MESNIDQQIRKWTESLQTAAQMFQDHFGILNEEQLNWKPNPDTWSIAQNMQHLIRINESYYPALHALESGNYTVPWIGRISMYRRWMGRFILNSVKPETRKKIKTFPIWEPGESEIGSDIVQQFKEHQEQLAARIRQSEPLLQSGAAISSPANRMIVYNLSDAFDIITTHEFRHFEQAKEVLDFLRM